MIKDRKTAETVLKNALNVTGSLNDSIYAVMAVGSEEEVRAYKRAVGHSMAEIFDRIVEPIFAAHPDLRPPEFQR